MSVLLDLLMVALSGCGHGEQALTVTQAEHKLTEQMSVLIIQAKRTGAKDIKMTFQDERSLRCPKGKLRHGATFTGKIITSERKPPFQVTTLLIGVANFAGLLGKDAYKVTYVRIGDPMAKMYNASTNTHLTLSSPATDMMIIQGFTDCLKMK